MINERLLALSIVKRAMDDINGEWGNATAPSRWMKGIVYHETLFWLLTEGVHIMEACGQDTDAFIERIKELGHITYPKIVAHNLFQEMKERREDIRKFGHRNEQFIYTKGFVNKAIRKVT